MKKVLFTAHVDSHILQFHLPYLKMFKENGYEVHVATNGDEEIPYCDKKHKISFERSPFKINNLKAIKQLKKIIDEEKFDVIHTHTPMGAAVTRLAAKHSRKVNHTRVIYTAHGLHFFKGSSFINWLVFYPVEKYLSKYTDTLILINQEDYDLCKKKFKKCHDIHFIKGVGIDKNKMNITVTKEEKKELLKSLGLSEKDFIIIYPAELSKRKRQVWLINSIKDLLYKYKDIKLLLPGKDSLNGELSNLIKKLKLEEQVLLLGYRKDIPKLLRISNLSISTANQEGLPVNIMEAMYVGLPIVVTDCRGNRDLITNTNHSSIVPLEDSEKFSKSIEKIYFKNHDKKYDYNIDDITLDAVMEDYRKIYFKKKKVLHVLSSNIFSGAENVACTIINNLRDDYDFIYCSTNGSIAEKLKEYKINFYPLEKMDSKNIKKVVNDIKPDVIHAHDFKASFYASKYSKNINVLSHLHNNWPWLKKINLKSLVFLYFGLKVKKIFIVSESIEKEFIFSKFIKNKFICIDNPNDRNKILNKVVQADYRKKYDICCVARLTEQKDPDRFIDILSELVKSDKDIKAVWVGDGELLDSIRRKVSLLKLEKNIDLVGFQNNPFKFMASAKLFVLTSKWEGYGLVAFEAMTLGLPCVVSNVGGLPKLITNKCGKLCDNDKDFVREISKLLKDNGYFLLKHEKSIEQSIKLHNIDKYCNLIKVYY